MLYKAYFDDDTEYAFFSDSVPAVIAKIMDAANAWDHDAERSESVKELVIVVCQEVPFPFHFHAESYLRDIADQLYEDHGLVTYDLPVSGEQEEDLERMILATLREWVFKHKITTKIPEGAGVELHRFPLVLDDEGQLCLTNVPPEFLPK